MFRQILNQLKCLVFGHQKFMLTNDAPVVTLFQSKEAGNMVKHIRLCERCCAVYTESRQMTEKELEAEKQYETAQDSAKKFLEEMLSKAQSSLVQDKNMVN